MNARIGVTAALCWLVGVELAGQDASLLKAGARVRVSVQGPPAETLVGVLTTTPSDAISIRTGERVTRIALRAITKVEVSRQRRSRAHEGAELGSVVGMALGATAVSATSSPEDFRSQLTADWGTTVASTFAGALVGGLIGSALHTEHWEAVPLPGMPLPPVALGE